MNDLVSNKGVERIYLANKQTVLESKMVRASHAIVSPGLDNALVNAGAIEFTAVIGRLRKNCVPFGYSIYLFTSGQTFLRQPTDETITQWCSWYATALVIRH